MNLPVRVAIEGIDISASFLGCTSTSSFIDHFDELFIILPLDISQNKFVGYEG